jgi:hypothetical protein
MQVKQTQGAKHKEPNVARGGAAHFAIKLPFFSIKLFLASNFF